MKLKDKVLLPFRVVVVFFYILIVFIYAWITGRLDELDN